MSSLLRQACLPLARISTSPAIRASVRRVTGSVSSKSGSKSFGELRANAAHEARDLGGVIAKVINASPRPSSDNPLRRSSAGTLVGNFDKIPQDAILFGASGLIPYAATSFSAVFLAHQAASTYVGSYLDTSTALALLHHVEVVQIAYGALILSFLGSVHFGLEIAEFHGRHRARYLISLAPILSSWVSLTVLSGPSALILQLFSFGAMWFVDQKTTTKGWNPRWYAPYRFALTGVVISSLLITLGGGAVYNTGSLLKSNAQRLVEHTAAAAEKPLSTSSGKGCILGDIKVERSDEAFVKFTNIPKVMEQERVEAEAAKSEEKKAREERLGKSG